MRDDVKPIQLESINLKTEHQILRKFLQFQAQNSFDI